MLRYLLISYCLAVFTFGFVYMVDARDLEYYREYGKHLLPGFLRWFFRREY